MRNKFTQTEQVTVSVCKGTRGACTTRLTIICLTFCIFNHTIYITKYGTGARLGLIGKPVKIRHGPAAVMGSRLQQATEIAAILGRRSLAMNLSQKNCLFDNHRFSPTSDGEGICALAWAILCHTVRGGRDLFILRSCFIYVRDFLRRRRRPR